MAGETRLKQVSDYTDSASIPLLLVGEPILMSSLARHLALAGRVEISEALVVNPLETACELATLQTEGEEDMEALMARAETIIADPLYRPIAPAGAEFIPISHEAFSGRCFPKQRVNLLGDFDLQTKMEF